MIKKWLDAIPKFVLGPAAVVLGIIYFIVQDPPKTICDTQFEIFKKENDKYIFGIKKKAILIPPGIQADLQSCQNGNSPGACFDWLEGLKATLHTSRNIPNECGSRIKDIAPYNQWLEHSLFLFSQISWNSTNAVRTDLFNWLEEDDMALFCRLKFEYTRLRGEEAYVALQTSLLNELVRSKKMQPKEAWPRTVLSHKCRIY